MLILNFLNLSDLNMLRKLNISWLNLSSVRAETLSSAAGNLEVVELCHTRLRSDQISSILALLERPDTRTKDLVLRLGSTYLFINNY